jgi:CDP-diacylglycerol pyrophosphatase
LSPDRTGRGWIGAALLAIALSWPAACDADRSALREIVQDHCLIDWVSRHDPAPCLQVVLTGPRPPDRGYAVLADRKGGAHFLLIPIESIPGIESPALAEAGAPNYFALAWEARGRLADVLGHPVERDVVGLAVNPPWARSQDQLHIHLECMSPSVIRSLDEVSSRLGADWAGVQVAGARFAARRLMGERLEQNPFEILARNVPDARRTPSDYTLLVGGRQYPEGPGFVLLAGTERAAELLLDSGCAAAGETS